jgi:hypothetical protein
MDVLEAAGALDSPGWGGESWHETHEEWLTLTVGGHLELQGTTTTTTTITIVHVASNVGKVYITEATSYV